jgi:hypothetical protein
MSGCMYVQFFGVCEIERKEGVSPDVEGGNTRDCCCSLLFDFFCSMKYAVHAHESV